MPKKSVAKSNKPKTKKKILFSLGGIVILTISFFIVAALENYFIVERCIADSKGGGNNFVPEGGRKFQCGNRHWGEIISVVKITLILFIIILIASQIYIWKFLK